MEKKHKKTKGGVGDLIKYFAYGLAGIIVLALIVSAIFSVRAVHNLSQNSFVLGVSKVLHVPVAKVNGKKITYNDYVEDLSTLEKFYTNPPEGVTKPTDEEVSDQVLSRLIANKLINDLALEYEVEITKEDLDEFRSNLLSQFESEQVGRDELMDRYGWTLEKYLKRVGEPILLEQKLQEEFSNTDVGSEDEYSSEEIRASHILFMEDDETNKVQARIQAEKVLERIKNGEDFAELAKEFGSDGTAEVGGDLGWFSHGMMVPEFEQAVFTLEKGQLSEELVETSFGYHIVKLTDKRYTRDFYTYMDDQFVNADIEVLLPIHDPFAEYKEQQALAEQAVMAEEETTTTEE